MMRAWMVAVALLVGCSKEGADRPSSRDALIAAWKKAGLEPSAFTPATTPVGKDCASGTVNGLDVLICAFATEPEAKAAEPDGLTWVGDATGASRAAGAVLVAVADRRKADPSGRTINKLIPPPAR
jgi:hypothetical protein